MAYTVTQCTGFLARRALLSKYHRFLRYMRECNFVYTEKKCMTFAMSIFISPTNVINFTNFTHTHTQQELRCGSYGWKLNDDLK